MSSQNINNFLISAANNFFKSAFFLSVIMSSCSAMSMEDKFVYEGEKYPIFPLEKKVIGLDQKYKQVFFQKHVDGFLISTDKRFVCTMPRWEFAQEERLLQFRPMPVIIDTLSGKKLDIEFERVNVTWNDELYKSRNEDFLFRIERKEDRDFHVTKTAKLIDVKNDNSELINFDKVVVDIDGGLNGFRENTFSMDEFRETGCLTFQAGPNSEEGVRGNIYLNVESGNFHRYGSKDISFEKKDLPISEERWEAFFNMRHRLPCDDTKFFCMKNWLHFSRLFMIVGPKEKTFKSLLKEKLGQVSDKEKKNGFCDAFVHAESEILSEVESSQPQKRIFQEAKQQKEISKEDLIKIEREAEETAKQMIFNLYNDRMFKAISYKNMIDYLEIANKEMHKDIIEQTEKIKENIMQEALLKLNEQ